MNKIEKIILSIPYVLKAKVENNTLKFKNEMLKNAIQEELYDKFLDKLGEPEEIARLKKENKNLRKKVKILKELLKEDSNKSKGEKRK